MHSDLKWPKVLDRLSIRSLIFIKNVISTHVPTELSSMTLVSALMLIHVVLDLQQQDEFYYHTVELLSILLSTSLWS